MFSSQPRQLHSTMENSLLLFKYKPALFRLFLWWIVYWKQEGKSLRSIHALWRRVLCKSKATQGLAVDSSDQQWPALRSNNMTGGVSSLSQPCRLPSTHCRTRAPVEPRSALTREEASLALMYSCVSPNDGGKGSDSIRILPVKSSLFSSPVETSCSFLQGQLRAGLHGWADCVKLSESGRKHPWIFI